MVDVGYIRQNISNQRHLRKAESEASKSMERLSSGKRINRAADDVARLSAASKMGMKIRSHQAVQKNLNDGISITQTAEGGLAEIQKVLSRVRELAVQAANDTNSASDRAHIQQEVSLMLEEVDRIAFATEFNGQALLQGSGDTASIEAIKTALTTSWLKQAEQQIFDQYGLTGDGDTLKMVIENIDGNYNTMAYVSYYYGANNKAVNQEMHIDIPDHTPTTYANNSGNEGTALADLTILHELTHAIMGNQLNNYNTVPTWFKEGTAEAIGGADARLSSDSSGGTNPMLVVNNLDATAWGGSSIDYSSGYLATRYMHKLLVDNGQTDGVKAIMTDMRDNSITFDTAVANAFSGTNPALDGAINSNADFVTYFKNNVTSFADAGVNVANTDNGALGGADASGGPVEAPEDVLPWVPNTALGDQPISSFALNWEDAAAQFNFQVGTQGGGDTVLDGGSYMPNATRSGLGLSNISVSDMANAVAAISSLDSAIASMNTKRSNVGALQNRLERALSFAQTESFNMKSSLSVLQDADIAEESVRLTRSQILRDANVSVASQTKQLQSSWLQLLS